MMVTDIPAIIKMAKGKECFRVSDDQRDYFWSDEQLRRWVLSDDILLVAEVDNEKIVGFVLTAHHKPTGKVTWENHLVMPEFQGEGIGGILAQEMERLLKEKGVTYLHFLVKASNLTRKHYIRRGYTMGERFFWFGKHI